MPTVFYCRPYWSFLLLFRQLGQVCDTERWKSKREQRLQSTLTVIAEGEGGIKTTAKNSGPLHLYSLYARKWPGTYIAAAKERGKHKELRLHWTEKKNAPSLCLETTKSNESYCWYRQSQLKLLCRRGGKPKKLHSIQDFLRLLVFPWIQDVRRRTRNVTLNILLIIAKYFCLSLL